MSSSETSTDRVNDHELADKSPANTLQWQYQYLEFNSELPEPATTSTDGRSIESRPPRPNLNKFQNPMEWSWLQKQSLLWQSTIGTTMAAFSAGSFAPAIDQMEDEFHLSRTIIALGITIFTIGFGLAPMVLAPFSEINGRRPVFVVTGLLFMVCTACCAAAQVFSGLAIARFIQGCAASTFSTMVGGVLTDMYRTDERNVPMAIYSGGVLFGTGLGPLIGGVLCYHTSWRWVFGTHAICIATLMMIVVFFFRESRGSIILSHKAKALNTWYEACEKAGFHGVSFSSSSSKDQGYHQLLWKVKADEERATLAQMIKISTTRPFMLLFTEPTVFFFSLWVSFSWAVLYLLFSVIPFIFQNVYGFNLQQSEAIFTVTMVSSIIFTPISAYQERIALHYGLIGGREPESRLWFAAYQSILLPVGLFWVGWTARPDIPWIVPALGIGAATMGIFSIYLATFNYLADSYNQYASSAIAGQSLCRNLLGGAFPLFADAFFGNVGIGKAASILGAIGVLLTMVPWVLALYGPEIRRRSKFASSVAKES